MDENETHVDIETASLEQAIDRAVGGGTVIVHRGGVPVAVVVGIDAMMRLNAERELLRRLALGELESAAGEGEELERVLDDCALLLEDN